jgi:hypothetical protein
MRITAPSRGRERQDSAHEAQLPPRGCEAGSCESGEHAAGGSPPCRTMRSPASLPSYTLLDASLWMCTGGMCLRPGRHRCRRAKERRHRSQVLSRGPFPVPCITGCVSCATRWLTQSWRVRAFVRRAHVSRSRARTPSVVRLAHVFIRCQMVRSNSCTYFLHGEHLGPSCCTSADVHHGCRG